jgi:bacterioferritin-associated ferredoxin
VFVCSCLAVTHRTIGAAVAAGARTVEEVVARCEAGGRCGGCWPELQRLVDELGERRVGSSQHAGV